MLVLPSALATAPVERPTRRYSWRVLLLAVLLSLGVVGGAVITDQPVAGAVSISCSWMNCNYYFTRWETQTIAVAAAAWLLTFGVPWPVAVALDRAADWAVNNGYCLAAWFSPLYSWAHTVWYYRC